MWMLIRANALGSVTEPERGTRTLAACPDTAERGDPWRWTVSLDADQAGVGVSVDADYIAAEVTDFTDGYTGLLHRLGGHQLVVAGLAGEALVAAENGPWERWLKPGDAFIVEGEEDETLRLSLAATQSKVSVVSFAPKRAHALRWVP